MKTILAFIGILIALFGIVIVTGLPENFTALHRQLLDFAFILSGGVCIIASFRE